MLRCVGLEQTIWLGAIVAIAAQGSGPSGAEAWPERLVKVIVPAPAEAEAPAVALLRDIVSRSPRQRDR